MMVSKLMEAVVVKGSLLEICLRFSSGPAKITVSRYCVETYVSCPFIVSCAEKVASGFCCWIAAIRADLVMFRPLGKVFFFGIAVGDCSCVLVTFVVGNPVGGWE